jgi:hypothetical protein
MRVFFVCSFLFAITASASAQDAPVDGTLEAPSELVVPAVPEAYALTVRAAVNADRHGRSPGEAVVDTTPEPVPELRASDPAERVLLEVGGAAVAVSFGLALGYAVGLMDGEESRTAMTLVFGYVALPSFTWLAGSIIGGGQGNWGGAFIGESVGACVGGLFAAWAIDQRSEEGMWTSLLLAPALGAILGLEIQHDLRVSQHGREAEARAREQETVSMSIAPTQGGAIATVTGSF